MPAAGRLPTCATAGVLGAITGSIASIASAEAIKLLVGRGRLNAGLIWIDLWEDAFEFLQVRRRSDCPTCVQGRYRYLEAQEGAIVAQLCGRDAVQVRFRQAQTIDLPGLARRLRGLGVVEQNEFLLRFRAEERELVLFADGRAIIKGTTSPIEARHLYAKYIGL
jgi:adenylyltransferase/sulfurtransferase